MPATSVCMFRCSEVKTRIDKAIVNLLYTNSLSRLQTIDNIIISTLSTNPSTTDTSLSSPRLHCARQTYKRTTKQLVTVTHSISLSLERIVDLTNRLQSYKRALQQFATGQSCPGGVIVHQHTYFATKYEDYEYLPNYEDWKCIVYLDF